MATLEEILAETETTEPKGYSLADLDTEPVKVAPIPTMAEGGEWLGPRVEIAQTMDDWRERRVERPSDIVKWREQSGLDYGEIFSAYDVVDNNPLAVGPMRKQKIKEQIDRQRYKAFFGALPGPFFDTRQAWEVSKRAVGLDFLWDEVRAGNITREEAERQEAEFQRLLAENPAKARNFAENIWHQVVQILPPMVEGMKKGAKTGVVAAAAAGVAGQAIPLPEEIATMPAAFKAGMIWGGVHYWAKQGRGEIYREAVRAGVSHETADLAASIGGPIYAAIEYAQIRRLAPILNAGTIARLALNYVKTVGVEVLEEGVQKVVTEGTVTVAKQVEGLIDEAGLAKEVVGDLKAGLREMREAVVPMAFLPLPGVGIDAVVTLQQQRPPASPEHAGMQEIVVAEVAKTVKEPETIVQASEKALDIIEKIPGPITEQQVAAAVNEGVVEAQREQAVKPAEEKAKAAMTGKPYEAIAYRGVSEKTPVDEGMYGKGTYYTTDRDYAANFGEVQEVQIRLDNPYLSSPFALEELARAELEAAKAAGANAYQLNELLSKTIREKLEAQGYDGIILPQGATGGKQEIIVFHPDKAVKPPAERVEKAPVTPVEGVTPAEGAVAAVEPPGMETAGGSPTEIVKPNLYIGNVTGRMKKVFAEMLGVKPEEIGPYTEKGWPTKRTEIPMTRRMAMDYLARLEETLDTLIQQDLIKTKDDLAAANAMYGDIKELRAKLGLQRAESLIAVRARKYEGVEIENIRQRIREATEGLSKETLAKHEPKALVTRGEALTGAMRKAQKESLQAWAAGRRELRAKQAEVKRHKDAVAALNKTTKKIKKEWGTRRGPAAQMLPELRETVETLLNSFQMANIEPETVVNRKDLLDMANQALLTAPDDSLIRPEAEALVEKLRSQEAKTFGLRLLDPDAIDSIRHTLEWAMHEQQWADRAHVALNQQKYSTIESESIEQMVPYAETYVGAFFDRGHGNLESLCDLTTGGIATDFATWEKGGNTLTNAVYATLDESVNRQILCHRDLQDTIRNLVQEYEITIEEQNEWRTATKPFTANGVEHELTVNERLDIYMHTRNSHNLQALRNCGIHFPDKRIEFANTEEIQAIVDSLTDRQKAYANANGDQVLDGKSRDYVNQASIQMEGYTIAEIDQYWPAERYKVRGPKGRKTIGGAFTENMGLTKERVSTGGPPLRGRGFFEKLYHVTQNVSQYYGLGPGLRDVRTILNGEKLQRAMEEQGHLKTYEAMVALVDRLDQGPTITTPAEQAVSKFFAQRIANAAKSIFYANPKLAIRQEISYGLIAAYVDPDSFLAGMDRRNLRQEIEEAKMESPQLRDRFENARLNRELGDVSLFYSPEKFYFNHETALELTGRPLRFFDARAIIGCRRAATAEVKRAHPDWAEDSQQFKDLRRARTEWLVRHSQPTWHQKDRSQIGGTRNPFFKGLTMFMSQREKIIIMATSATRAYQHGTISGEQYAKVIGAVLANAALISLFDIAFGKLIYREKKDFEDFLAEFAQDIVGLPYGGAYAADLIRTWYRRREGIPWAEVQMETFPLRMAERFGNGLVLLTEAAIGMSQGTKAPKYKSGPNKGEYKWKTQGIKGLDAVAEGVLTYKGIPYVGPKYMLKAVNNWLIEPEKEN